MSRASYIIICDAETSLLTTNDPLEQLRIATRTAGNLSSYLCLKYDVPNEDVQPLSDIMHFLEAHNPLKMKREDIEAKVQELIEACETFAANYEPQ